MRNGYVLWMIFIIATMILFVLKVEGYIDSWWTVFVPVLVPLGLGVVLATLVALFFIVSMIMVKLLSRFL